jgi:hypothetical protein
MAGKMFLCLNEKGLVMSFAGLVLLSTTLAPGQIPNHFEYDFRKNPTKPGTLKLMGKEAKSLIQFQQGGVQFTFPDKKGAEVAPVGIGPTFKLRGDFTITAAFEIQQEAEPAPASSGLNLHIYIDTNTTRAATLLRSYKPGKGIQLVAHQLTRGSDGKGKHVFHPVNATGNFSSGQLRIKRTGTKLTFLTAEGTSATFQQFHELDWVADDVRLLRVGGTNSKAATPFRFRILALEIKSEELPTYAVPPEEPSSFQFYLILGLVTTAVLAGAAGVWVWKKRNKPPTSEEEEEEGDEDAD